MPGQLTHLRGWPHPAPARSGSSAGACGSCAPATGGRSAQRPGRAQSVHHIRALCWACHDSTLKDRPKLAQLLRSFLSQVEYGEYIEAEPNYELALMSLGQIPVPERGGDGAPPPGAQVLEKSVTSDGDIHRGLSIGAGRDRWRGTSTTPGAAATSSARSVQQLYRIV